MEGLLRYLDDIVVPTIKEFEDHPTSVRHAFLACVAAFHAIDYLTYPRKRSSAIRDKFRKESAAFSIVDDVAHAFKHVVTGPRNNPNLRANEIIPRPPAYWDVSGAWDLSRWDDPVGGVTLDADRRVDLLDALNKTVEFWRTIQT